MSARSLMSLLLVAAITVGCMSHSSTGEWLASRHAAATFIATMEYADPAKPADPTVSVDIAGSSGRLVVDTGAVPTILTDAFARGLRLGVELNDSRQKRTPITLGDARRVTLPMSVAVVPAIAEFDADGLGGLLSPLSFGDDLVVVLDFPGRVLWALPRNRAKVELNAVYGSRMSGVLLRRVPASFGVPGPCVAIR